MESPTYLVTVSGPDRVGVGAELFAALASLEGLGVEITDVAQITIRGALVLCAEVATAGPLGDDVISVFEEHPGMFRARRFGGQGVNKLGAEKPAHAPHAPPNSMQKFAQALEERGALLQTFKSGGG